MTKFEILLQSSGPAFLVTGIAGIILILFVYLLAIFSDFGKNVSIFQKAKILYSSLYIAVLLVFFLITWRLSYNVHITFMDKTQIPNPVNIWKNIFEFIVFVIFLVFGGRIFHKNFLQTFQNYNIPKNKIPTLPIFILISAIIFIIFIMFCVGMLYVKLV